MHLHYTCITITKEHISLFYYPYIFLAYSRTRILIKKNENNGAAFNYIEDFLLYNAILWTYTTIV